MEEVNQVTSRGPTFLFTLLCVHGHCYGAHVGVGEGRKDPSFSLYTHLPVVPSVIFYDIACSLEEYNMNRVWFMSTLTSTMLCFMSIIIRVHLCTIYVLSARLYSHLESQKDCSHRAIL